MDQDIDRLIANIIDAARRDGRSEAAIATEAGLHRGFFTELRRTQNPTIKSLLALAKVIDYAPLQVAPSQTARLTRGSATTTTKDMVELPDHQTIDSVLAAWNSADGRVSLLSSDVLTESVIFARPFNEMPQPYLVGDGSLAAAILPDRSVHGLEKFLRDSPPTLTSRVAAAHIEALKGRNLLSIESRTYVWADGVQAPVDYARLLLPVKAENDELMILSFSKQI